MNREIKKELLELKELIQNQSVLQKEVFNMEDTALYLGLSKSHLYKLTSTNQIPHYCPQGKKLYFMKAELNQWLTRNKSFTTDDVEKQAADFLLNKKFVV